MSYQLIYVVSDSVGETAELVVKAAASQFNGASANTKIKRIPYVEDRGTIIEVLSLAKQEKAIVCFTLVVPELREFLIEEATRQGVVYYDIIGPLIDKMETSYGITAKYEPGRVRKLDDDYFKRLKLLNLLLNTMMAVTQEEY